MHHHHRSESQLLFLECAIHTIFRFYHPHALVLPSRRISAHVLAHLSSTSRSHTHTCFPRPHSRRSTLPLANALLVWPGVF
jgi:hypothetical protein